MPIAAIFFDFDPIIAIDDRSVSLWSLVVIAGMLLSLACGAFLAARSGGSGDERLSQVDLWMLALGAVPGAVIGGRLGYVLLHLDYYTANAGSIVDASQGAFQLSLAIVGGALTGAYVARVIDAPVGRWLHVAAVPVLGLVVIGKVGMALGGAGQGNPSSVGWATAYLGDGPWGSLAPAVPSEPSQLYEAGLSFAVLAILVGLIAIGSFHRRSGMLFVVALELWLVARFAVAFTWRDPSVVGPLVMDQLISMALLAGCVAIHVTALRRRGDGAAEVPPSDAMWPESTAATGWRRTPGSRS